MVEADPIAVYALSSLRIDFTVFFALFAPLR